MKFAKLRDELAQKICEFWPAEFRGVGHRKSIHWTGCAIRMVRHIAPSTMDTARLGFWSSMDVDHDWFFTVYGNIAGQQSVKGMDIFVHGGLAAQCGLESCFFLPALDSPFFFCLDSPVGDHRADVF